MNNCQIPTGMQDTLPEECYQTSLIEKKLGELFYVHGFKEIKTPLFEYYQIFTNESWGLSESILWKTMDNGGRILVVRPDSTIPCVRLAVSKMEHTPLPIRLCYFQTTVLNRIDTVSSLYECPQAGIELIGETSAYADAEVIALSIKSLKAAGLEQFKIDIGHMGYFFGFLSELGFNADQSRHIAQYINDKNTLGLRLYLEKLNVSESKINRLEKMTDLYGDVNVLETALTYTKSEACRRAIENLYEIIKILTVYGLTEYISIDLSMVEKIHYYTGVVFKGITPYLGQSLLSGGRYDHLASEFGSSFPAVGFALVLKHIMIALETQGFDLSDPMVDMVLGFEKGLISKSVHIADDIRKMGQSAVLLYDNSIESVKQFLRDKGALNGLFITPDSIDKVI